MKVIFTQYRHLPELNRTVRPGETMTTDDPTEKKALQAYVDNSIAAEVWSTGKPRTTTPKKRRK